jgi:hypothetical protein
MAKTTYYLWDKPNDGDGQRNGLIWGDKIRAFMDDVDSLIHNTLPPIANQDMKFLTTDGNTIRWDFTPIYLNNPMRSSGDLIVAGNAGAAGRLGIGLSGQVLTVLDGNTLGWTTQIPSVFGQSGKILTNNGLVSLWTTFTGLPTIGNSDDGKFLTINGTTPQWTTVALPSSPSGQSGKFLGSDGNTFIWSTINQIPSLSGQGGKLLINDGASAYWSTINSVMPTQTAQAGKFLTTNGTVVSWQDLPSGFANPMSTYADLIVGYTNGNAIRLPAGTNGQVLSTETNYWDANVSAYVTRLKWISLTSYLTNPMTSQGDTIYGGASGVPSRLGIGGNGALYVSNGSNPYWLTLGTNQQVLASNGSSPYWLSMTIVPPVVGHAGQWLYTDGSSAYWTNFVTIPTQTGHNGQYLTTDGTNLSWTTVAAGFVNPMTSAGDLIAGTTGGVAGRLPLGNNGQVLTVVNNALTWATPATGIPTQTGNQTKFLTTDGTNPSWVQIYQVPTVVGKSGLFLGNDGTNYSWMAVPNLVPDSTGQTGKYLSNNGINPIWVPYNGLPALTGNSGKILTTDGVTSFWVDPASAGSGVLSRVPITVISSSLDILAQEIKTVDTTCKTYQLQTISADTPCRVRIYGTYAAASADLLRSPSLDPTGNHGMYAEIVLTSANPSWIVTPVITVANDDTITSTNTYITITNNGSSTKAIQLNLGLLKME